MLVSRFGRVSAQDSPSVVAFRMRTLFILPNPLLQHPKANELFPRLGIVCFNWSADLHLVTEMELKVTLASLLCITTCLSAKQPNIIILLADDMGWNDIGTHGSEIPTPNIDALAYSGVVLRRHYAQPSCTPSRAALFTGQYPIRYGLQGSPIASRYKDALPTNITIMPQVLKNLGYRTHLVGKWHQGYPTWSHFPTRRGFDSFFGYLNGFLSYYDGVHYDDTSMGPHPEVPNIGLDFRVNETESWPTAYAKYLPQLLSEQAQTVVRDHNKNHKNSPLFLLVSTNAPHAGGNRRFADEVTPHRSSSTDFITDHERRTLADVMRYVDNTLGDLVTTLKSEGMLDDSLIMFLSDNGGPSIDNHVYGRDYGYNNGASNYPFRGTKMSLWEGGVRVPAILWKSGLDQNKRTYDNLFHMTDWLPTLNAAAGGDDLPALDGVNQWSAITGNQTDPPRSEFLVEIDDDENSWAYMKGDYKFVKSYKLTSGRMKFDQYFSPQPQVNPAGYDIQGVLNSSVAKAFGTILDRDESLSKRSTLMLPQSCGIDNQTVAALHDCSYSGCLFDVMTDPTECFDISSKYPDIMMEMETKLNSYRAVVVPKRKLPADNLLIAARTTSSLLNVLQSLHNLSFFHKTQGIHKKRIQIQLDGHGVNSWAIPTRSSTNLTRK
ncbi:hypothetical protein GE061_019352 [Apolygus lucorum]|uniref:Sulfatase N-terminal domain-containing protein n=1 Tax=Apolygus lucorum TaxID=248454 RepID=A0A8S9XCB1_APOLU|nr:hypothetical protein GE061_019352 [Apolygus lucorum]